MGIVAKCQKVSTATYFCVFMPYLCVLNNLKAFLLKFGLSTYSTLIPILFLAPEASPPSSKCKFFGIYLIATFALL